MRYKLLSLILIGVYSEAQAQVMSVYGIRFGSSPLGRNPSLSTDNIVSPGWGSGIKIATQRNSGWNFGFDASLTKASQKMLTTITMCGDKPCLENGGGFIDYTPNGVTNTRIENANSILKIGIEATYYMVNKERWNVSMGADIGYAFKTNIRKYQELNSTYRTTENYFYFGPSLQANWNITRQSGLSLAFNPDVFVQPLSGNCDDCSPPPDFFTIYSQLGIFYKFRKQ